MTWVDDNYDDYLLEDYMNNKNKEKDIYNAKINLLKDRAEKHYSKVIIKSDGVIVYSYIAELSLSYDIIMLSKDNILLRHVNESLPYKILKP